MQYKHVHKKFDRVRASCNAAVTSLPGGHRGKRSNGSECSTAVSPASITTAVLLSRATRDMGKMLLHLSAISLHFHLLSFLYGNVRMCTCKCSCQTVPYIFRTQLYQGTGKIQGAIPSKTSGAEATKKQQPRCPSRGNAHGVPPNVYTHVPRRSRIAWSTFERAHASFVRSTLCCCCTVGGRC